MLVWLEVLYWIDYVWCYIECVCCACGPSEHIDAPSICLFLYVGSLRAGSQVFALLMLFLCVILHTMSSGKSLRLLCIFPFGMLCLSAISMMSVNILLAVCMYIGGYGGLSESGLCPVSILVVGECPSGLL